MFTKILKYVFADLVVLFAFTFNNPFGKRNDLHGRTYKDVYKRFGHEQMVYDYLYCNSWNVRI